jgi:simple sugar transport system permease protein
MNNYFRPALPQLIIGGFLIALFVTAAVLQYDMSVLISGSLVKFAMNGIFVLAMIPMINAGVGLNFGLSTGITAGLIGLCVAIQLHLGGFFGFFTAVLCSIPVAVLLGFLYGKILNRVKGKEDIAAIFIGFSFIPLMNFFWTVAPFSNREMLYPIGGVGLRPKISLANYFSKVLDGFLMVPVGPITVPLGLLIFYGLIAGMIYLFFKTKKGQALIAIGSNEVFCRLSGLNIDKNRILAVILSTVIAGIGICVYAQSYGFVELYDGPTAFAFPAVSAILVGGCTGRRATIFQAILGTYLYQTIFLLSAPIANTLMVPQMAEIVRMIITNGIILYAFLNQRKAGAQ